MKTGILLIGLFLSLRLTAQVNWQFSAVKQSATEYELHLKASIDRPWHLYSQFTPAGGPLPTFIKMAHNPVILVEGQSLENGKLIKKHEAVFGIDVQYFEGEVDFVAKLKLKAKVKTSVSGSVKYMVCNDKECLPPKTIPFSVRLQ